MYTPGLTLVTAPVVEPLELADVKTFLRVDHIDEDTLITALIKTARRFAENYTGRALINQTWAQWIDRAARGSKFQEPFWDGWREGAISELQGEVLGRAVELLRGPVSAISSITSYDVDDAATVMDADDYMLDDSKHIPAVVLKDGVTWPVDLRVVKSIKIEFVAGYGAAGSDVPGEILMAMQQLIAHWYEHREAVSENAMTQVPLTVSTLLDMYKVVHL